MCAATVPIVLGGVLQVAGVLLVAWSLRGALRRLAQYEHRPQEVFAGAASAIGAAFGATGVTTEASLEDRVAALERRDVSLRKEIADEGANLRDELLTEIEHSRTLVTRSYQKDFEDLSDFATTTVTQQRPWTYVSVVLIVVGVILSTIGSVIA
jgi:hypothetical protein